MPTVGSYPCVKPNRVFFTTIPNAKTLRSASPARKIVCCETIQLRKHDLKGQTVAVVGLGISGRAAVRLALARGASVVAIDRNEQLVPLEQDPQFMKHVNLRTVLGHCDGKLLRDADRVVVSPGVPLENNGLSALLQAGRQVMSELDFAAEILPNSIKILAVTGTNGKSTVTTFAGQILHHLGIKTFVGGNLGNPLSEATLQCLESSSAKDIFQVAVVEVSSYQMEIPNKCFCPSVAVVLNLTPDHLERHKTMHNYALMKCHLFSHMKDSRLAVLPADAHLSIKQITDIFREHLLISSDRRHCLHFARNQHLREAFDDYMDKCNVAWIGDFPGVKMDMEVKVANLCIPTIRSITRLQLGALKTIGTHNYHNAAVAAFSVIGLDVGIDTDSINATIEVLRTPPHRMQIVHTDAQGVMWVDDSKATNVEAAYAGLMGLKGKKSVVLLGGVAKDLNMQDSSGFEKLVEPLKYHRCVVTFGSSGKMIQKTLCDCGLSIPCVRATNLDDAVNIARSMARYGDAILLSPGCASFDEFRNFEHRGKVFQELALSAKASAASTNMEIFSR